MSFREKFNIPNVFWKNEVFITWARWLTILGIPILLWFYQQKLYYNLLFVSLGFMIYNGFVQRYLLKGFDSARYAALFSLVDAVYLTYVYIHTLYITQSGLPQLYYFLMLVMGIRHGISRYPWVVVISIFLYIGTTIASSYLFAFKIYPFILFAQILFFTAFGIMSSYLLKREHLQQTEKENLINELQSAYQQLWMYNARVEELANTDPLTGLYNYRFFTERFHRELELSKRFNKPLSLIIIDIDHFKIFNDTYGHLAGDEVLKESAEIFRQNIRDEDTLCRYGGEEFLILLPATSIEEAHKCAERIRKAVAQHVVRIPENNKKISITVSGGVASYPIDAVDGEHLIKVADDVLYEAKHNGRNRIVSRLR